MTASGATGKRIDLHEQMMEVTLPIVAKTLFDAELASDMTRSARRWTCW